MINIDYKTSDGNRFDTPIRIDTGNLSISFKPEQIPLHFDIIRSISGEIIWSIDLGNNCWATYPSSEMNDVLVTDAQKKFVMRYYWNVMEHGSIFYRALWLFCKNIINSGRIPNGIVIGTHDGEFGEWAPIVKNFMSNVVLVEGSRPQFEKLQKNYFARQDVQCIHDIITTNGNDVTFFEGGRGYTNSVVEKVIRNWETEEIHSTKRTSTSLNNLIKNKFNEKIDWMHLDVEGLDAQLIMSLENNLLPSFMIFEIFNISQEEKDSLQTWLRNRNYETFYDDYGGIGMASRKF